MKISEITVVYKTKVKAADRPVILNSEQSADLVRTAMEGLGLTEHRECCIVIPMNRRSAALGWYLVSIGGLSGTVIDPKVVFQLCLGANAAGFILAHNHPSGNLKPSPEDNNLTQRIKEGARILDLKFLDHLIITTESYYSYADEGNL